MFYNDIHHASRRRRSTRRATPMQSKPKLKLGPPWASRGTFYHKRSVLRAITRVQLILSLMKRAKMPPMLSMVGTGNERARRRGNERCVLLCIFLHLLLKFELDVCCSRWQIRFSKARNLWWHFGGINFVVEAVPRSTQELHFILFYLGGPCGGQSCHQKGMQDFHRWGYLGQFLSCFYGPGSRLACLYEEVGGKSAANSPLLFMHHSYFSVHIFSDTRIYNRGALYWWHNQRHKECAGRVEDGCGVRQERCRDGKPRINCLSKDCHKDCCVEFWCCQSCSKKQADTQLIFYIKVRAFLEIYDDVYKYDPRVWN